MSAVTIHGHYAYTALAVQRSFGWLSRLASPATLFVVL